MYRTCVTVSWLQVLLIEFGSRPFITAPSETRRSVKKRDLAQGCAEGTQKSVLFNRCLTMASIWRQRSNKQEKKGSLLPSALPLWSNIYANSHANPDFFQSDIHARAHVHVFRAVCDSDLFRSRLSLHGFGAVFFFSIWSRPRQGHVHSSTSANL